MANYVGPKIERHDARNTAFCCNLRLGDQVGFVRYELTRDGWQPKLTEGLYGGIRDNSWLLLTDQGLSVLPTKEWSLCLS